MYSRNNEDDLILGLLGNNTGICVDIGAGDGRTWSNSLLFFERGYKGVACECDIEKLARLAATHGGRDVSVMPGSVSPDGIGDVIGGLPKDFDYLTIDIDGYDYYVLESILATHKPKVICCEINAIIPPPVKFAVRWNPGYKWDGTIFFGMSVSAVAGLLLPRGYRLARVVSDNAIFTTIPGKCEDVAEAWRVGFLEFNDPAHISQQGKAVAIYRKPVGAIRSFVESEIVAGRPAGDYDIWL